MWNVGRSTKHRDIFFKVINRAPFGNKKKYKKPGTSHIRRLINEYLVSETELTEGSLATVERF